MYLGLFRSYDYCSDSERFLATNGEFVCFEAELMNEGTIERSLRSFHSGCVVTECEWEKIKQTRNKYYKRKKEEARQRVEELDRLAGCDDARIEPSTQIEILRGLQTDMQEIYEEAKLYANSVVMERLTKSIAALAKQTTEKELHDRQS